MEHSNVILSILICSLTKRNDCLCRLLDILQKQIEASGKSDQIEILVEIDNGEMPIGQKRNILLNKAKGEYICYVDDDDIVTDNYISLILDAVKDKPDCVGIEGILKAEGEPDRIFKHSIAFQGWYTGSDAYYRTPNHLNPVKRIIAQKVGFRLISNGEDHFYSMGIRPLLVSERYIAHPIYIYSPNVNKNKQQEKTKEKI